MRKVFFSFAWDDVWRVNQVRHTWVAQGYESAGYKDKAEIETVKRKSKKAIKSWIDKQMHGTSVTCVLIGEDTSNSEWVQYEIEQSMKLNKGILIIYIHNTKDNGGNTGKIGENPLSVYKKTFKQKTGKTLAIGGVGLSIARLIPVIAPVAWIVTILAATHQLLKDEDYYKVYDWVEDNGRENIGDWVEKAARQIKR